jgi:uncharacterized protein YukE
MASIDFRMGYDEIQAHCGKINQSADKHGEIQQSLKRVQEAMAKKSFVGFTGIMIQAYINDLNGKIDQYQRLCDFLVDAMLKTVTEVRGPLEDGLVSKFGKGK